MSTFHRQRLLSGIRETHQVPVQSDWAYAIRKQARLILLPLFREVVIDWFWMKWNQAPKISPLAENLYKGLFQTGDFQHESEILARKKVGAFLTKLTSCDKGILKFYFLSDELTIELLSQQIIEPITDDPISLDKIDKGVGKQLKAQFKDFSDVYLESHLLHELREIENILSNSDLEIGLDTEAITRINKAFSDYLDIPYGEISLIQKPGEEWDYWERVYEEERKTIGKKLAHDKHKEWLECWLLPDGDFKVKGDLEFPEDSDHAAKTWIQEELQDILVQLETRLIESYSLEEQDIKYTFFTKREDIKNCELKSGIAFFADQIDRHGAYDLQLGIKFYLVSEIQKDHQIWSARTSFDFDKRLFDLEDQMDPVSAWVVTIEEMIFQLEAQLSMMEKEKVIDALFNKINKDYLKQYGD